VCDMFILCIESVFPRIMNSLELHNLRRSVIQYDILLRVSHKMAFSFAFLTVLLKSGAAVIDTRPHACTLQ
jgi:uncharacterized membrane protein